MEALLATPIDPASLGRCDSLALALLDALALEYQ